MALLNQGMGNIGNMGGNNLEQIMQMLQMSQQDPFSRPLPGDALLGGGDMQGMQNPSNQFMNQSGMQDQQANMPMNHMNHISTDFADTQPGLPNLPDNFKGFGYGQYAPQQHAGNIRQQMIRQMMQQFQSMSGGYDGSQDFGF